MASKRTYAELEQRVLDLETEVARLNRNEQVFVETENRLRNLIQGSPIPTFVMDTHHVITMCNRAYERLRGLETHEIVGTHGNWLEKGSTERPFMADYIVERAPEEEMSWYYGGKCRKSKVVENAWEAEIFFPEIGPEGAWLFVTAAPLLDSGGNMIGAIETLQDITERKEAESALREGEKRLFQIVQGSPIPSSSSTTTIS